MRTVLPRGAWRVAMMAAALNGIFCSVMFSEEVIGRPGESAGQRDARMRWWREARFGMFIHWGVYSVPAGTYIHGRTAPRAEPEGCDAPPMGPASDSAVAPPQ